MNAFDRIKTAIDKYNEDCNGQSNLASPYARADLAELIYNAVMKQTSSSETHNLQQVITFSNIDSTEHK